MNLHRVFKNILITAYKTLYQACYFLISHLIPLDEKKIVMAVYRSNKLEGNLKFIYNEILKQDHNAKIHLIFPENKMNLMLFKDLFAFCNAKYLIIDDFFLPVYLIKPRKSLKIIQLWHAAGAFKKFGYSTIDKSFGADSSYLKIVPVHSNYTHVYVSSKNVIPHYAEAFNMNPNNIYPTGIPRTDMFFNKEDKENIVRRINSDYGSRFANKVVILFAPTYRAQKGQKESDINFTEILSKISRDLLEDKVIVYKPHPYLLNESIEAFNDNQYENIIVADKYSVNDWMLVSDAFITDYSSAIFEYAIMQKPMAHFVPDLHEYESNRGLYYPIETISDGEIIKDYSELISWINDRSKDEYWNTDKMMKFNFSNVNNTSEKITKHFLSENRS